MFSLKKASHTNDAGPENRPSMACIFVRAPSVLSLPPYLSTRAQTCNPANPVVQNEPSPIFGHSRPGPTPKTSASLRLCVEIPLPARLTPPFSNQYSRKLSRNILESHVTAHASAAPSLP
jgi:hypothetical protein